MKRLGSSLSPYVTIPVDFIELAELLLKNGAKLETQNEKEQPIITQVNSVPMAKLVLHYGANLEASKKDGVTALMASVESKNKELISFFIELDVDPYQTDKDGYTAFHRALWDENLKYTEYLLQYFDIKKCHAIKSVFDIADNPQVNNLLRRKLGLKLQKEQKSIGFSKTYTPDTVFLALKARAEALKARIQKNNELLLDRLPDFEYAIDQNNITHIFEQLKESLNHWENSTRGPVQALYLEYSGDVVDPFDACALFWGFENCNDQLQFSKCVLEESGDIDINMFFEDIGDLYENFEKHYYEEIKPYLETLSFISIHLAFHHLINSEDFKVFDYKFPFYLIGSEHDQDKTLIYKKTE